MTRTTTTIIYDNNNDNQQEHNLVPSEWTPAARCLRPDLFPPPTHLTNKEEQDAAMQVSFSLFIRGICNFSANVSRGSEYTAKSRSSWLAVWLLVRWATGCCWRR